MIDTNGRACRVCLLDQQGRNALWGNEEMMIGGVIFRLMLTQWHL